MKIQLNKILFGLPAKSFFIDYTVSQKRQLPVVKEFVVRLLHALEKLEIKYIQTYFGFSSLEVQAVIDDLLDENLIEWEQGAIKLTHYASEKFVEKDGCMIPRFFEVADKLDTIHFELNSFQMLPKGVKPGGVSSLSINLSLPDENYSQLEEKAKQSFDLNFQHFREIVKGEDIYQEQQELYKINNVTSKYDSLIPIEVEYFIDTNTPQEVKTGYTSSTVDEWDEDKRLFTSMDQSIYGSTVEDTASLFQEYINATNDPFLSEYWDEETDSINIQQLIHNYHEGIGHMDENTHLIIGNLYSDFNSTAINELLSKKDGFKNASGLIWLTNANSSTWGRNTAIDSLVTKIKSRFDQRKKTSESIFVMECSSKSEAYELRRIYGNIDTQLQACSIKFGGENCEVMLIPNTMIASLYHIKLNDQRNLTLPIGFISVDETIIDSVSENIKLWAKESSLVDFFERPSSDKEKKVVNRYFFPILEQDKKTQKSQLDKLVEHFN